MQGHCKLYISLTPKVNMEVSQHAHKFTHYNMNSLLVSMRSLPRLQLTWSFHGDGGGHDDDGGGHDDDDGGHDGGGGGETDDGTPCDELDGEMLHDEVAVGVLHDEQERDAGRELHFEVED